MGVYWFCASAVAATNNEPQTTSHLIIGCASSNPIANELDLRVGQVGTALRHPIAGDSGAGDFSIEIRIGEVARHDALQRRHFGARNVDRLGIRRTGCEQLVLLVRDAVMTAELSAGRREDFVLNSRESGGRIDGLATAARLGRQLFQLAAT